MKKSFCFLLAGFSLFASLFFVSCGDKQSSPTDITKAALECMKKGDAKGYVELIDVGDETDPAKIESGRTMLTGFIMMGLNELQKRNQGIKDYEVLSEEVINDSVVKVNYQLKFNDGTDKKDSGKCIRRDGKWYLKM